MTMIEIIFWIALFLLVYAFIGYPVLIWILSAVVGKSTRKDSGFQPSVSMILSVYNEEDVIEGKIENFLSLDYPEDLIEFVIISDCCSDQTEELIQKYTNHRIRLFIQNERKGKTLNLNLGVEKARGEILVFTDANSMFDQQSVKELTRHFIDSDVGLVSGKSVYLDEEGSVSSGGVYRQYEDFIKDCESRVGGIIGADGAIYALRKSLYTPLNPAYINDFIHTCQAISANKKAINDLRAICYEEVKEAGKDELRRQTRIMAQSWLIFLSQFGPLLKKGRLVYCWQLFSHKFLRWLTFPLAIMLLGTNFYLVKCGLFFQFLFLSQLFFLLCISLGTKMEAKIFRIPYFFALLHFAALVGLIKFLNRTNYITWNPRDN